MKVLREEPVLVMGVVQAVIALVSSFGLQLSADQTGTIMAVAAAVLALLARTQTVPKAIPIPPPAP